MYGACTIRRNDKGVWGTQPRLVGGIQDIHRTTAKVSLTLTGLKQYEERKTWGADLRTWGR